MAECGGAQYLECKSRQESLTAYSGWGGGGGGIMPADTIAKSLMNSVHGATNGLKTRW